MWQLAGRKFFLEKKNREAENEAKINLKYAPFWLDRVGRERDRVIERTTWIEIWNSFELNRLN